MRYLAFDIECIDGMFKEGNICEFGYVLTDDEMNIIEQEDILIKPITKATYMNRRNSEIVLSFPMKRYYAAPPFEQSYDKIISLLSAEDTLVIGHAVHNDVFCVNMACIAHKLPMPTYFFIDSQIIYALYKEQNQLISLDKIAADMGEEFLHHRADEDAKMALLSLKYVLKNTGLTLEGALEKYNIEKGFCNAGEVSSCRSVSLPDNSASVNSKSSKRKLIAMLIDELEERGDTYGKFTGKRFAFAGKEYLDDCAYARRIMIAMYNEGARYVRFTGGADIVIAKRLEELTERKVGRQYCDMDSIAKELTLPDVQFNDEELLEKYAEKRRKERREIYYKQIRGKKENIERNI